MRTIALLFCTLILLVGACSNNTSTEVNTGKTLPQKQPVDSSAKADSILNLTYNKTNWSVTTKELARWDSCKARQIDSAIMIVIKLPSNWSETRQSIFALDTMKYGNIYAYGRNVGRQYQAYYDNKNKPKPVQVVEPVEPGYYNMTEKPVIYLYPTAQQNITVNLNFKGTELYTWPKIEGSTWAVNATPDGMLTDIKGEEYPYLFWEGNQEDMSYVNYNEGFVVAGNDAESFLTEKLKTLGLNARERADFITYWAPRMRVNNFNFIRFETKAYANAVPLTITPAPASMQRVLMVFKQVDKNYRCKAQELLPFTRKGFTVIEWGGMEMPEILN